ncbi:hypothetical protein P153DRAFT_280712 [Dothidotthia symphoricarpi CBS 119687]|uniref:Rhodopsin domain-containing protein n=1 Tax=Dothidotthia symphoricarpi CBS 119687 TaxID=1392245 RepID=A0A6A6AQT2_9PLEO|nr:uncharacterized protein P153DRAFT_280712 [Dothidotthia symphoricarpi CBS 119687]KAF2134299.1 hypothetical protein P153DRAFT_280712 [Dothidotthia symphoricarpi CBS 119687]
MISDIGLGTQGPVQRGWGLWLTSVLAVAIAALFVGARFVQRRVKRSGLGVDDYAILVALIFSGILSMTECQAVVYGYGRHWKTLPSESRITARQWFYAANIVYKMVLMFNKISVVCLYYRIFAVSHNSFRIACHIMNAWIIASGTAFVIATVFQCTPIAAFWDRGIEGYKCFKNEPWWISYATTQIVTDILLLAMPVRQILTLSLRPAEKLGICLVFGSGAFVTFASIYRATTIAASASDPDPTWGPIPATIWSVIEANAGIICACLPMFRGPFVHLFGFIFGLRERTPKPRTYPLTWSGRPQASAVVTSSKRDVGDSPTDSDGDSEEEIVMHQNKVRVRDGKGIHRSPSGIFVKNEFVMTDELAKRRSAATSEGQGDTNMRGKSPFFHI